MLNNNGSAIPEKAQKILDSGLTRMRFSLDAFTQKHTKMLGVGSIHLDRVKKNIEDFLNLKER